MLCPQNGDRHVTVCDVTSGYVQPTRVACACISAPSCCCYACNKRWWWVGLHGDDAQNDIAFRAEHVSWHSSLILRRTDRHQRWTWVGFNSWVGLGWVGWRKMDSRPSLVATACRLAINRINTDRQSTLTLVPLRPLLVEHSNSRFESIRFDSLSESIRIDSFSEKKSAFRFTSCHAVFAQNK